MSRPLSPSEMYPAGDARVTSRFIKLSTGTTVRVAEAGPAAGAPIVMMHGWAACLYAWRHALVRLAAGGARCVAVDLAGHGLSDKPHAASRYSLAAYRRDLHALLDALAIERPMLIGHSMGGGIALRYALQEPERVSRLALINPVGLVPMRYTSLGRVAPLSLTGALGRRLMPRWMVELMLRYVAFGDASKVTERDVDEYWAPTQLNGFVYAARSALTQFEWRPLSGAEADALAIPTVVILGREDRLVPNARRAAERLNGARVEVFDGGHCVHEEQPDAVYGLIRDFMR